MKDFLCVQEEKQGLEMHMALCLYLNSPKAKQVDNLTVEMACFGTGQRGFQRGATQRSPGSISMVYGI